MSKKQLETANYWANQLEIGDKPMRDALVNFPPDGTRGKQQPTYFLATVWAALKGPAQAGDLDGDQQRARKDKELADKLAMQNAITRGEVAVVEDLDAVWTAHVAAARARLLAMPSKLAPQLVGLDANRIQAQIKTEVYAALAELAEYTPGDSKQ
jgi:hypothetical protein